MNKKKLILGILLLIVAVIVFIVSFYFYSVKKEEVGDNSGIFIIESGTKTDDILKRLQEMGYINNIPIAKLYIRLNNYTLKAGSYSFDKKMSMEMVISKLMQGDVETKVITFVEGKRLTSIIKSISDEFDISEEEIKELIKDQNYIKSLIDKYWFLTDEVLNKDIYYPLEGYLFPDTYVFRIGISIEEIIESMLDNTESKLKIYKETITESEYSVHQILTIASIIELEASKKEDRKDIGSVIYSRLELEMSLGMCTTTYYAVGKEMTEVLTMKDLNTPSPYNTRDVNLIGLPVGPITNPGIISIDSSINPADNEYLYFLSDKNNKLYFNKTYAEHESTIIDLKKQGLWD